MKNITKRLVTVALVCFLLMQVIAFDNTEQKASAKAKLQTHPPIIYGIKDIAIRQGDYLDIFEGITASDSLGRDISSGLRIEGDYNFGVVGEYIITYVATDNEGNTTRQDRKIKVIKRVGAEYNSIVQTAASEPTVVPVGKGSYYTGDPNFVKPRDTIYIADSLKDKPKPSNGWWQSLMIENMGSRLVLNPLLAKFTANGINLTNPGDGYYTSNGWRIVVPNNDNFDLTVGIAGVNNSLCTAIVQDYSDYGVVVSLSDNNTSKMLNYLNQGSPYIFSRFSGGAYPTISSEGLVAIYNDKFESILEENDSTYKSDHIFVEVRTLAKVKSGTNIYENRFYTVNAPSNSNFTNKDGVIHIELGSGADYLSVGSAPSKDALMDMYEHGYAFVVDTIADYTVDYDTNNVETVFSYKTEQVNKDRSNTTMIGLQIHQYSKSDNVLTDYVYKTVRGDMKLLVGNTFTTNDKFGGIVPTFTEPDNIYYSRAILIEYLKLMDNEISDSNLYDSDLYWQGKKIQPLALGVLIADQIGETALRDSYLRKLKIILEDWCTYTQGNEPNSAYMYYGDNWGSMYWRVSNYGGAENMSDHHFTYGYVLFSAAVLGCYDSEFVANYGQMIDMIARDYMTYDRDDNMFCYLRNYDPYAGHSWAGGFANNDQGNNQEAGGESLHGYVGAYLWSQINGDKELMDAAVYIFTTELVAIKEYWFNYSGTFNEDYPYGVAGQVWGTEIRYNTYFGNATEYIYGIHWLPVSEYLTNYVTNETEREQFKTLYMRFLTESKAQTNKDHAYHWRHIVYPMHALVDPMQVMRLWNANNLTLAISSGGDSAEKKEAFNLYYMVNSIYTMNIKTTDIWVKGGNSASVYQKTNGDYIAIMWNPTSTTKTFEFTAQNGKTQKVVVEASTLKQVKLTLDTSEVVEKPKKGCFGK